MITDAGFEWACFISYRSGNEELTQTFVDQFCKALSSHIEPYVGSDLKIYRDRERLKGGDFFNQELATSLCKSLCMIMIFTPTYFDQNHRYCAREYIAMEFLEQQRLATNFLDSGLIIPVIFRGANDLPDEIKNNRFYCDFSKFTLCSREIIRNRNFVDQIEEIAIKIGNIRKRFNEISPEFLKPCTSFQFPDENDPEVERLVTMYKKKDTFPGRK